MTSNSRVKIDPPETEMETCGMSGARLLSGMLGAGVVIFGATVAQCVELPAGPNREVVSRECQVCHDLDMVAAANGSREAWNDTLDEMTRYGMRVTPEERAQSGPVIAAGRPASTPIKS